ncbi:NADH dehydrogenase [ubiquinone] 1 alpha subcomplex subunit 1-like [Manihot esculenta]|nr:NADH dehydrogenase [ubiquinone] 1 alpha subcomplex subunit 1-like [Manihot esculenta]
MKRSVTEESLEPSTSWKRKNSRRKGRSIEFFTEKQQKMSWLWLEAALPLGIIAGMLCVMGNAQYYIHRAAHGRPKHIGNDMWDVAMERRDKKLVENLSAPSPN